MKNKITIAITILLVLSACMMGSALLNDEYYLPITNNYVVNTSATSGINGSGAVDYVTWWGNNNSLTDQSSTGAKIYSYPSVNVLGFTFGNMSHVLKLYNPIPGLWGDDIVFVDKPLEITGSYLTQSSLVVVGTSQFLNTIVLNTSGGNIPCIFFSLDNTTLCTAATTTNTTLSRIQDSTNTTWVDTANNMIGMKIGNNQTINITANATRWQVRNNGRTVMDSNGTDTWIYGASGSVLHIA